MLWDLLGPKGEGGGLLVWMVGLGGKHSFAIWNMVVLCMMWTIWRKI